MAEFGSVSRARLETCVEPIQRLMDEVVKDFDCTILEGERSVEQQRRNVARGVSKTMDSKHLARLQGQSRGQWMLHRTRSSGRSVTRRRCKKT